MAKQTTIEQHQNCINHPLATNQHQQQSPTRTRPYSSSTNLNTMTTTSPTSKGKLKATTYYSDENPTGTTATQEEWPEQAEEEEEERTGLLDNHQQKPSTKHKKNSRRRNSNKPIITPSIERESLIERIRRLGTQTYTGKSRTIPFNPPDHFRSRFPPNIVRNQKYNLISFIPLVLYEQFKFFFNLYFLAVAMSQFVPALRIGLLMTYVAPLGFVLMITIGKEAHDDYLRRQRDSIANSSRYQILDWSSKPTAHNPLSNSHHHSSASASASASASTTTTTFTQIQADSSNPNMTSLLPIKTIPSAQIRVGDILLLDKNMRVPADLVLLRTSDQTSGSCFIRTDQLDGETDWKLKLALEFTQNLTEGDAGLLALDGQAEDDDRLRTTINRKDSDQGSRRSRRAEVYADKPIMDIHTFNGTLLIHSREDTIRRRETESDRDRQQPRLGDDLDPVRDSIDDIEIASMHEILPSHRTTNTTPTEETRKVPITSENVLWANTVLAAGQAVGLVIYTGTETRAVMNTSYPKTKTSLLDIEINQLAKILCIVTFTLSVALVALNGFRGPWWIYVIRFLILFSSIIPISLRVNLDMGKTVYAHQIENDLEIPGTIVRTSTLPEELGRIEYLLSDKTGTLTQNEMELKKLHMGTVAYGLDSMDEVALQLATAFGDNPPDPLGNPAGSGLPTASLLATRGRRDMSSRVKDVILGLGLCHNVTPVTNDDGSVTYQASSPDEVAIVAYTESVGLKLVSRDRSGMSLRTTTGQRLEFEVLEIFPFTSESKRMGIIIREKKSGELTFYQKGADVVMAKIVQSNDWLEEECDNMSREGLRTLVMAKKKLSQDAYQRFTSRYLSARVDMVTEDRQEAIQRVIREELENNLELLGVTGVEDKLQEDVKSTLELLRNAGLKIWMLTGDKIETATCIAISSKLVSRGQYIHQVSKLQGPEKVQKELEFLQQKQDCCLVIDGESLASCLSYFESEFIEVTTKLPVVVACRCSPTQKAEIAKLIRLYTKKRVCCIGDGGNDVSMIQAADVGVGIVGKEGKQASLAADFSINQFSFLTKLLLWHGRNSYKRSAKLAQFVIHRGLIISVIQAVFSSVLYFAPVAIYQGWLMMGYATCYTMAPVFSLVLDQDVNEDVALLYPELYKELTKGRSLSYKSFFTYFMSAVFQGGVIMILSLILFENEFLNIVSISFTSLILTELLMVALEITTWHRYMIVAEVVTLLLYLTSMAFLPEYFDLSFVLTISFLWKVSLITAVSSVPLYIAKALRSYFAPASYAKLRDY
ncbi:phospholipid-translocating ATPase [Puccinia graminis f. sp. tritici CRL 75-36-700-3]|uniref:Phospholipid-transporting ATPase n=1 Tax=Puccinia graminis f. sp. tritici (strain CRL 75-36-700-3 / race SCCL) TaxID=418459 RepID=E3KKS6_PUCGT|nr:phospholipid-translocating ATPase [Puccinia graminis f. sp. tritici CRL 75-36-700-3]EFP84901.2 phospholipid-translocating ATPase [Puccinia graminis f. sp. tritici CRL 75-36-700-3]